jgi:hypothetical protein
VRRNRRAGIENRWRKVIRDADGTKRTALSARDGIGLRWMARLRCDVAAGDQRLWSVVRFDNGEGSGKAHLVELGTDAPETHVEPVENLVVVGEFRHSIYPGLIETGSVECGGDSRSIP